MHTKDSLNAMTKALKINEVIHIQIRWQQQKKKRDKRKIVTAQYYI